MSETLWTLADGPAAGQNDFSDGLPGITTATTIRVGVAGQITDVRFYATLNAQADPNAVYRCTIWHVDAADTPNPAGTKIAQSATFLGSTLTPGAWNQRALITPINVTPNNLYRVGLHSGSSGRYCATNHGYDNGHTSAGGHLFADGNLADPIGLGTLRQGTFVITTDPDVYPSNVGNSANYWPDVVFTPSASADQGAFLPFFG